MEALRKKRNSSQGASILLALLFLLVCMMVGASLLMAAVSNAGKIRSNREEQQKYLTLSSALALVCDALEDVEYYGQYRCIEVKVSEWQIINITEEGVEYGWVYPGYNNHYYWREEGVIRSNSKSTDWELKDVLPLFNDLEAIFAGNFELPDTALNYYDCDSNPAVDTTLHSPYVLNLTVNEDETTYGGLVSAVAITVELKENGVLVLTAVLADEEEYVMEAVLDPSGVPKDVLVLTKNPEHTKEPLEQNEGSVHVEKSAGAENKTQPLTWTLRQITKKEAAGG